MGWKCAGVVMTRWEWSIRLPLVYIETKSCRHHVLFVGMAEPSGWTTRTRDKEDTQLFSTSLTLLMCSPHARQQLANGICIIRHGWLWTSQRNYKSPSSRPNFPSTGSLPRLPSHASRVQMRIINHAYPPPPPPPLIIDSLHNDHDGMSQRRLDDDQQLHRPGAPVVFFTSNLRQSLNPIPNTAQNPHDPSRPPYPSSPATVSNPERPLPDPTTIRTVSSAPHHTQSQEWRPVQQVDHRNGEHIPSARDSQVCLPILLVNVASDGWRRHLQASASSTRMATNPNRAKLGKPFARIS